MPQVIQKGSSRKRRLGVGSVVLVLIAIAGLVYGVTVWRAQQDRRAYDVAIQLAGSLDHHSRYKDEQSELMTYLRTNPPKQYRIKPLMILGNLAFNERDDTGAIDYYKQAVASNEGKLTEIQAESIGQAAAAGGNKVMALEYFKKAVQLTVVKPGVGNDLDDLKATVNNLESGQ